MTVLTDFPDARPALLMDFANSQRVHPLFQITRSGTATCCGPDGVLRTLAANVPRIDFDPATGKCLGLLLEGSSTNLLLQSNNFQDVYWAKTRASTPDASDADGWTKLTEDATAANTHILNRVLSPSASLPYVWSIDVKAGTRNFVGIEWGGYSNQVAGIVVYLDMNTGAVAATVSADRYQVRKLRDGWRVSVMTTTAATIAGTINCVVYMCDAMGNRSYDGNGAGYMFVRNAQAEQASFPSSYIPTTTAQVTRAGDAARMQLPDRVIGSSGFGITGELESSWNAEYAVIFSDEWGALGNFAGVRFSSGPYINSTESGRTGSLTSRVAAGQKFAFAASIANGLKSNIAAGDLYAGAAVERAAVDFKTRKFMKLGTVSLGAAGVWRYSRLALYAAPMTEAQARKLASL